MVRSKKAPRKVLPPDHVPSSASAEEDQAGESAARLALAMANWRRRDARAAHVSADKKLVGRETESAVKGGHDGTAVEKKEKAVWLQRHGDVLKGNGAVDSSEPCWPLSTAARLLKWVVMQAANVGENNNKFYSIELHGEWRGNEGDEGEEAEEEEEEEAEEEEEEDEKEVDEGRFRIFTHYGRTGDLLDNPLSGRREMRYFDSLAAARSAFATLYFDKTSARKGYQVIELASALVGSSLAQRHSARVRSAARRVRLLAATTGESEDLDSSLTTEGVFPHDLVRWLYSEAAAALTTGPAAIKLTANGLETPLGVLTTRTVARGERKLDEIEREILLDGSRHTELERLAGEFFSIIPHRLGRSRDAIKEAVIRSVDEVKLKRDTLQLMKDMLVIAESAPLQDNGAADFAGRASDAQADEDALLRMQYAALKCTIRHVGSAGDAISNPEFDKIRSHILDNQQDPDRSGMVVRNLWALTSLTKHQFNPANMDNVRLLFHGSRPQNFCGLLSRGLLLPQQLSSIGVKRTNFGWLGPGLYFGSQADTAAVYAPLSTTPGRENSRLMLLVNVALGKSRDFTSITADLDPDMLSADGYASAHGVKRDLSSADPGVRSSPFTEDEWVVYRSDQQQQMYLVEFYCNDLASGHASGAASLASAHLSDDRAASRPVELLHSSGQKKYGRPVAKTRAVIKRAASRSTATTPARFSGFGTINSTDEQERFEMIANDSPSEFWDFVETDEMLKNRDDQLRSMFADANLLPDAADPFVNLVDVYGESTKHSLPNIDSFVYTSETTEEKARTKLFESMRTEAASSELCGRYSVVSTNAHFLENWRFLTSGLLDGLDWSNVFVAGGIVLGCLRCGTAGHRDFDAATSTVIPSYKGYEGADIDLFLVGIQSQDEATAKLRHIYECIQSINPGCRIIRTQYAVTVVNDYPRRNVQIVLRLYRSPAEVLLGFDVDSCSVGFDGARALVTPRARRALNKCYNLVDMDRRSLTYEVRLLKYAKRGFAPAIDGLKRGMVDPIALHKTGAGGLLRLLQLEYESIVGKPVASSISAQAHGKVRRKLYQQVDAYTSDVLAEADAIQQHRLTARVSTGTGSSNDTTSVPRWQNDDSDYESLAVPWGPRWYTGKVLSLLGKQDRAQFFRRSRRGAASTDIQRHHHVFVEGIDGVIEGKELTWCRLCRKQRDRQKEDELDTTSAADEHVSQTSVRGKLRWINENPGRQLMTGSFHPLSDDAWWDGVYSEDTVQMRAFLANAALVGDSDSIQEMLLQDVRVAETAVSGALSAPFGISALGLACLLNRVEVVSSLLNACDPVAMNEPSTASTRLTPLHLACFGGSKVIVSMLVERGCDVSLCDEVSLTPAAYCAYYGLSSLLPLVLPNIIGSDNPIDKKSHTLLHLVALGSGNVQCAELILAQADSAMAMVNAQDADLYTPVKWATVRGHLELRRLLIACLEDSAASDPADVTNCSNRDVEDSTPPALRMSFFGSHPLVRAVAHGDRSQAEQILRTSQPPPTIDLMASQVDGKGPLHIAAYQNDPDLCDLLLSHGASIDVRDKLGRTPLDYAARSGSNLSLKVLLEYASSKYGEASKFVDGHANVWGHSPLYTSVSSLCAFRDFANSALDTKHLPVPALRLGLLRSTTLLAQNSRFASSHTGEAIPTLFAGASVESQRLQVTPWEMPPLARSFMSTSNRSVPLKSQVSGKLSPSAQPVRKPAPRTVQYVATSSTAISDHTQPGARMSSAFICEMFSGLNDSDASFGGALMLGPQPGGAAALILNVGAFAPTSVNLDPSDHVDRAKKEDAIARLLLLLSMLANAQKITTTEKLALKSLLLCPLPAEGISHGQAALRAALTSFEVSSDISELIETLKLVSSSHASVTSSIDPPDEHGVPIQPAGSQQLEKLIQSAKVGPAFKWTQHELFHSVWTMDYDGSTASSGKLACFELFNVLCFPTGDWQMSSTGWRWRSGRVLTKLLGLVRDGFNLVLFTELEQLSTSRFRLDAFQQELERWLSESILPIQCVLVAAEPYAFALHKPATLVWEIFCDKLNRGIHPRVQECVFVGSHAGRDDSAESTRDRAFAANLGMDFFTPEQFFGEEIQQVQWHWHSPDPQLLLEQSMRARPVDFLDTASLQRDSSFQELILLVGPPGCGKRHFAFKNFVRPHGYSLINISTVEPAESRSRGRRELTHLMSEGRSVVVADMNATPSARRMWIDAAQVASQRFRPLDLRAFVFVVSDDICRQLNSVAVKEAASHAGETLRLIPAALLALYRSQYVEPTTEEGFSEVHRVEFAPDFASEQHREWFLERLG